MMELFDTPALVGDRWTGAWDAMNRTLDDTGYVSFADIARATGMDYADAEDFIAGMTYLGYIVTTGKLEDLTNRWGDGELSKIHRYGRVNLSARPTPERLEADRRGEFWPEPKGPRRRTAWEWHALYDEIDNRCYYHEGVWDDHTNGGERPASDPKFGARVKRWKARREMCRQRMIEA